MKTVKQLSQRESGAREISKLHALVLNLGSQAPSSETQAINVQS